MPPSRCDASLVPSDSTVSAHSVIIEIVTRTLVAFTLALLLAACGRKEPEFQVAQIVDLTTSTTELLRDFDAHASEPRFVTIVAPS